MAIVPESSTSATGVTHAKPTGTSVGDVLVALMWSSSNPATITGFTHQVAAILSASLYLNVLTRVVDGSEGASFTVGPSGQVYGGGITRFSGVDTSSLIEGTPTTAAVGNSKTVNLASVTTLSDGAMLLIGGLGLDASGDPVTSLSFSAGTEQWEQLISNHRVGLATEARPTAGATGSRTVTHTQAGSSHAMGVMLALKPANTGDVTVVAPTPGLTAAVPTPAVSATRFATVLAPTPGMMASVPTASVTVGSDITVVAPTPGLTAAVPPASVVAGTDAIVTAPTPGLTAAVPTASVAASQNATVAAPTPGLSTAVPTASIATTRSVTVIPPTPGLSLAVPPALVFAELDVDPWQDGGSVVLSPRGPIGVIGRRDTPTVRGYTTRHAGVVGKQEPLEP